MTTTNARTLRRATTLLLSIVVFSASAVFTSYFYERRAHSLQAVPCDQGYTESPIVASSQDSRLPNSATRSTAGQHPADDVSPVPCAGDEAYSTDDNRLTMASAVQLIEAQRQANELQTQNAHLTQLAARANSESQVAGSRAAEAMLALAEAQLRLDALTAELKRNQVDLARATSELQSALSKQAVLEESLATLRTEKERGEAYLIREVQQVEREARVATWRASRLEHELVICGREAAAIPPRNQQPALPSGVRAGSDRTREAASTSRPSGSVVLHEITTSRTTKTRMEH